jgi:hypothetical protein
VNIRFVVILLLILFVPACKHRSTAEFISIKDPVIALQHVRVIDGTGSPAREDQTIIIDAGRITAIGPTAEISVPASAKVLDLSGLTAMPGLVGMGFVEAAQTGIDNLEHGMAVDTEFFSRKKADECPERSAWLPELARRIDVTSEPVQAMIRELVNRRVAVTSTLAIFEAFVDEKFQLDPRMQNVLSEDAFNDCQARLSKGKSDSRWSKVWDVVLKKEMQFEREFVKAGGLLMTGVDPTGWGGVVAGFGDQRGVELLVTAGFTPEEAIRIATLNGATFLGEDSRIGTLTTGKQADIVIVRGNPATNIADIRNVQLVFKDGVGYDPAKLIESVRGLVGER